jgi:hypothetical protein
VTTQTPKGNGKVTGQCEVKRACGHTGDFTLYEIDPYREERLEKFAAKLCPECSAKASGAHNAAQAEEARKLREAKAEKRIAAEKRFANAHRRDAFAGAAMTGLLSSLGEVPSNAEIARKAFAIADAMLAERDRQ